MENIECTNTFVRIVYALTALFLESSEVPNGISSDDCKQTAITAINRLKRTMKLLSSQNYNLARIKILVLKSYTKIQNYTCLKFLKFVSR